MVLIKTVVIARFLGNDMKSPEPTDKVVVTQIPF